MYHGLVQERVEERAVSVKWEVAQEECAEAASESFNDDSDSVVCFMPDRWVSQKALTLCSTRGLRWRGTVQVGIAFNPRVCHCLVLE